MGWGKSTCENLAEEGRVVIDGHGSKSHLYWARKVGFLFVGLVFLNREPLDQICVLERKIIWGKE